MLLYNNRVSILIGFYQRVDQHFWNRFFKHREMFLFPKYFFHVFNITIFIIIVITLWIPIWNK